eukprot:5432899-Pleurochrysis_carterae.AAC.1
MAWNWGNFDCVAWAKSFSCVAPDFGHQSQMRYWIYQLDENFPSTATSTFAIAGRCLSQRTQILRFFPQTRWTA